MSSGPDHAAPGKDEGDKDRRISYSRESLLSVRRAASEALPAGVQECKIEVEAALMTESDPRGPEPPHQGNAGSKSKLCTRFFSNADCRFGAKCRFLHHEQAAAVAKKMNSLNLGLGDPAPARAPCGPTAPTTVKTRLCKNHDTPEGCKWGDRCHFAHGDGELGKPMGPGSSFKTRLCVSFVTAGSCAFKGRCHFAHGKEELRSSESDEP